MKFSTLIDAATLQQHLGQADWCVLDVRHQLTDVDHGERAYKAGHIPGARFLHCDRDLSGEKTGSNGRHPLPDPVRFAAMLAEIGISQNSQVIVYDDAQGMIAGRLWWMLRWIGHDAVAVLDGGLASWLALGGELRTQVECKPAGNLSAQIREPAVSAGEVLQNIESGERLIVDARSPDRFRGENETLDPVGGHIPGAANRFFRDNLAEDGRFKSAERLRQEWLKILGEREPERIVHQCGSGVSACHNMLAMEYAGLSGSRLYAGSWSEWCADSQRPVVR